MDRQLIAIFKALADQNRLRILAMLFQESLFVCEIGKILDLAFSTTSKHLTILAAIGMGFIMEQLINSTEPSHENQQENPNENV